MRSAGSRALPQSLPNVRDRTHGTAERTYRFVLKSLPGPNVNPGYKLVYNSNYPQIAEDYERMWSVLKSLPSDIFLGAHGGYFGLEEKCPVMQKKAV